MAARSAVRQQKDPIKRERERASAHCDRFDKLAANYLAFVKLASIRI